MGYPFTGLTLPELQREQDYWQKKNFPDTNPTQPLLGIIEEVGELSHHHLKLQQGIRGSEAEHQAGKIDAVGDILIFLAQYCNQNNIDMQNAIEVTWDKVKKRDWTKDKICGGQGELSNSQLENS